MYKSNNIGFYGIKYFPLVCGIILLILGFWIIIDPTFEVTVNEVKRKAILTDCIVPFSFAVALFILHFTLGQRVVKMTVTNSSLEFDFKGKRITKSWKEVETIKKYRLVAPPLYSVSFEDDDKSYFFNSGYFFITTPFFVFDLSEMGNFIKERRKRFNL